MSDYIDRQAAIDALDGEIGEQAMRDYDELIKDLREYAELVDRYMWDCPYMVADSMNQAADAIEELLSSAQPEIIYCKDCVHNKSKADAGNANCELYYGMTYQMGYCYMGERRDE